MTFPKATLEGVNASAACTPLPVTGMTELVPCVVATVTFPVTLSLADGRNVRLSEAFCPGVKVMGVVIPLAETSLAETVTSDSVTLELPLLVMVTLFELAVPALTFPKLKLLGLGEIVTEAASPVPLTVATFGEVDALLETVTLPLRLPAVNGANSKLKVAVLPTPIVVGVFNPLALKPAPATVICVTVSDALPVFVRVKFWDFVCPSTTLPNANVAGEILSPAWVPVPARAIVTGDPTLLAW